MVHLAIMDRKTIEMILNKEKIIESRFSKNKITPYNKVSIGDIVYLKESGKEITACFKIKKIIFYDELTPEKVRIIKAEYNNLIKAPASYWDSKLDSNYGTLMYIEKAQEIKSIKIAKKGRQGFVSYDKLKVL